MQTYEQAMEKLKALGEEHLLRYYEELSPEEQGELLSRIEALDPVYLRVFADHSSKRGEDVVRNISPIDVLQLKEIQENKETYLEEGLRAEREGALAAVLLAGGVGTRLGASGPKGAVDIGLTHPVYIFQRIFESIDAAAKAAGRKMHLFVMTSESNREESERFILEHECFGYDSEYVHFFNQEMAPCVDEHGRILLETKSRIAMSPNGNGGWFVSLMKAGYGELMRREGIKWLNVFSVDNVLQKVCDPVFFGAVLKSGMPSGSKVVRKKSPEERVGVMCLDGGRASVVEYYELTNEMRYEKNSSGDYAYYYGVILNYLFRVSDLEAALSANLPVHFAHKSIPYLDPQTGHIVKPQEPNGWKFEYFIFDILSSLSGCLPFEVEREREFAPVKNAKGDDSVDTARELLLSNGVNL